MIALTCPECIRTLNIRDDLAGKRIRCPSCKGVIPVPVAATLAASGNLRADAAPTDLASNTSAPGTETVDFAAKDVQAPRVSKVPRGTSPSVPGFEILEEIGRGGMGLIFKARQLQPRRVVALKMLLGGAFSTAEARARFVAEADAVAKLQHPHIVQLLTAGEANGHPYLAMEFIDGGTLSDRLAGKRLPWREAAEFVETLARAVHYAHRKGIIHRDLKPGNILLSAKSETRNPKPERVTDSAFGFRVSDFDPKIVDFGLAKQVEAAASVAPSGPRTQSGAIMGTPAYMAPEQAEGKKNTAGPAVDVYGLGAILYECLTGRRPFEAAVTVDLLLKVVTEEPTPPRRFAPKVPVDVETVCLKCLCKNPDDRYESALALAKDLRAALDGESIVARPPGVLTRVGRWLKRRKEIAYLAGGALAAVVVVAVVLAMRPKPEAESAAEALNRDNGPKNAAGGGRAARSGLGPDAAAPGFNGLQDAARRQIATNNLKQLTIALHNYHSVYNTFPPAVIYSSDGSNKPLFSWRVEMLPYLEEANLYNEFHRNEPWDSPHNIKLVERMPKMFTDDTTPGAKLANTYYQAVVGPGAAFERDARKGLNMFQFTDGTANTIMLVEAGKAVPWSAPQDVVFNPNDRNRPVPDLGGPFPDGYHVALVDGSVRFIKRTLTVATLRAALTRAAGDMLGPDWERDGNADGPRPGR